MNWVREHCHVIDHPKFLEAGVHARDLWEWGMKYSGKHELDGVIPMSAVIASPWGHGGKANIKAATKLVEVGLWERTDSGFKICRWSEMGNQTKSEIEESRRVGRETRAERRKNAAALAKKSASSGPLSAPDNEVCPPRTTDVVPTSTSYSSDPTGRKASEVPRGPASDVLPVAKPVPPPATAVSVTADPQAPPPDWFDGVLATVHGTYGVEIPKAHAWLRYAAHRASKSQREGRPYPPSREDALHWLSTVMVKEASEAREKERQRRDRDARFDKERKDQREAAAAPQPYHRIVKPPKEPEPVASPEEQAEAMKKIADLFNVGKTGT